MTVHRLELVVKIKVREEKRRLKVMVDALARLEATRSAQRAVEASLSHQSLRKGMAAEYCASEMARLRALACAAHTRSALNAAVNAAQNACDAWAMAHTHATRIRQVADARQAQAQQLNDTREQHRDDEWTTMRFLATRVSF